MKRYRKQHNIIIKQNTYGRPEINRTKKWHYNDWLRPPPQASFLKSRLLYKKSSPNWLKTDRIAHEICNIVIKNV